MPFYETMRMLNAVGCDLIEAIATAIPIGQRENEQAEERPPDGQVV
jgi:hypothetical protein